MTVKKLALRFLVLSVFILFFLASTGHFMEGDTFWHIKTGQWIWEHKTVPAKDIYSYTSQSRDPLRPHSVRQELILKGYWLSQPIFYLVYASFGVAGVVIMRALVISLILMIMYLWLKKLGIRASLILVMLFLAGLYLKNIGDRPHYVSFFFFPLTAILLEQLRSHSNSALPKIPAVLLCILMLVWANMHGGYVMGVALIIFYLIGVLVRALPAYREAPGAKGNAGSVMIPLLITAIFVTLLNPLTYKVFLGLWYEVREGVQFQHVAEMMPAWRAAQLGYYNPTFWLALLLTSCVLLMRWRGMPLEHLLALLFFGLFAVMVQRIIPFFLMLLPFVALELEAMLRDRLKYLLNVLAAACIGLLLLTVIQSRDSIFDYSLDSMFPVESVAFLNELQPKGNIFNYADWGGYLMVYAPRFKVFYDGRRLMDDLEIIHNTILLGLDSTFRGMPLWKTYLEAFNIEVILVPSVSPHLRDYCSLVERLYQDSDWSLVFRDKVSLVYLKKGGQNDDIIRSYSMPKEIALIDAIGKLHTYATVAEQKRNARIIGNLYTLMNRLGDAGKYYEMTK